MAASSAQKAIYPTPNSTPNDQVEKKAPEFKPIPEGGSKVIPFPSATSSTQSNQQYTKLSEVEQYAKVAFDLTNLTEEQREILQTTFANLRTILDGTKPEFSDDYWINTKVYVLSDDNRLELRIPYLGNRPSHISEEEFAKSYLPPSRLLGVVLALSRVFSVPTKDKTPHAVVKYLQDWGAIRTLKVIDGEIEVVNEVVVRKHWLQISGIFAVTQTEYQKIIRPEEEDKKTAETTDETREEKQASTAVVPPAGGATAGQPTPESEGGGEGEPAAEPTQTPEQPTATQVADQRFNLAVERERLTNIALAYYCNQWNIEPTDEIRQLVRVTFLDIANQDPSIDLKSVSTRFRLLEQLTLQLVQTPQFVVWYQDACAQAGHPVTIDPQTNAFALDTIPQEVLADPTKYAAIELSNLLADVSGGALSETAIANLSDIIEAYAVGFGDNQQQPAGKQGTTDFADFIASLSDDQLVQIIFAGVPSSTNSKELLTAVKKRRAEIEAILKAAAGEHIFNSIVSTLATASAGALTSLGLNEEVKRDPAGPTAVAFRQLVTYGGSPEVVTTAIQDEHPLTNNKQEAQDYLKQMAKTWNMLPLAVQKQVYLAWGRTEVDFTSALNPEGTQATFLNYTGLPIEKFIRDARKAQDQHQKLLAVLAAHTDQTTTVKKQELLTLLDSVQKFITETEAKELRKQINLAFLAELTPEQRVAVKNQIITQRQAVIDQWVAEQAQPLNLTTPAEIEAYLAAVSTEEAARPPEEVVEYLIFFAFPPEVPEVAGGEGEVGEPEQVAEGGEDIDWGDVAPAEIGGATDTYNRELDRGNPIRRWRNRRKKIIRSKAAAQALRKVAAKKAGQELATTAAAAVSGPVGWAAKAASIAAQMRTEEGRKRLKQQILTILGGGVILGAALMGFLGEVGGGIFGAIGGGSLGAGIGAFAGTFIFPGVGTAVGALIGAGIGGTLGAFGGKTAGANFAARQAIGGSANLNFHAPSTTGLSPTSAGATTSPTFTSPTTPGSGATASTTSTPPPNSSFSSQAAPGQPSPPQTTMTGGTGGAAATPAVATAATLGGVAATLTFASAATWMPLMSIGVLMFISLYTIYTIFAAFLSPIPVGTGTSVRDGSGNQYLTIKKTVSPNQIPNIVAGQPTTVTYTVVITPKAGYHLKLLNASDTMKSLPAAPQPPEKKAVWISPSGNPYITNDSFAPLSPEGLVTGQVQAQYPMQFTEGVDALVTNTVTIKYDVFKTTGETVVSNQTFTDYSSLRIGNPKVLCWPTTGYLTQLPFCESHSSDTHCRLKENAFDIANSTIPLQTIYAPIDGEARGTTSATGYGLHVSLRFTMPDGGRNAEFVFGHLSAINPSISNTEYTSINQGDPIGRMGSTGMSTGYHLHFELKNNPPTNTPLFTYRDFLSLVPEPNNGIAHKLQDYVQTCYGN